jgi:hypothetical protein
MGVVNNGNLSKLVICSFWEDCPTYTAATCIAGVVDCAQSGCFGQVVCRESVDTCEDARLLNNPKGYKVFSIETGQHRLASALVAHENHIKVFLVQIGFTSLGGLDSRFCLQEESLRFLQAR